MAVAGLIILYGREYEPPFGVAFLPNLNRCNDMKNIVIALSMVIFILSACGIITAMGKTSANKKITVVHEVKYTKKGTRSEGKSGYLIIDNVILPDCFIKIVADRKVFEFKTKNNTWGSDGYFPSENEQADVIYSVQAGTISDVDISKGWSEVSGRRSNVPDGWIFVQWENGSAAVAPDKISELINKKSIKQIQRHLFSIKK
jgi:hypothetical protein